MGYSTRYHAASLLAVFIALAVGILIGIGLADDVVSTASQELESSLRSDVSDAESRAEDLQTILDREQEFGDAVYPALVANRLAGTSVALIGIGALPETTATDVKNAIEPAGAKLDSVAVLALPPDRTALLAAAGSRFSGVGSRGSEAERDSLSALGRAAGQGITGGSRLLGKLRGTLFSRFSGSLASVDHVVLVPAVPGDLDPEQQADVDALARGFYEGVRAGSGGAAGAIGTDADAAMLDPLSDAGLPTVDHVDIAAGKTALVFSLLGAEGSYGVGDEADGYLPELIAPAPGTESVTPAGP